jgi:hypothetical protein
VLGNLARSRKIVCSYSNCQIVNHFPTL